MKKIRTTLTTGAASLGLVVGLATFAGASSGSIGTTGPYSDNEVKHSTESEVRVVNRNDVTARNDNHQRAESGEAEVRNNTNAGDAWTGDAENDNSLNARVSVDNSGAGAAAMSAPAMPAQSGTIDTTGPYSDNKITTTATSVVDVRNTNNVTVTNTNNQQATSGDATVSGNTNGGSAMTGNVSNSNSTTLDLSISN